MQLSKRYHPERYRITRPFAKKIATIYQSLTGTATIANQETFIAITTHIQETYNDGIMALPFEQRPENLQLAMHECSLAMHYAAYVCHGRQVFHFNDDITEQFRHTDVDEIKVGALLFPYSSFYMSFGKQPDLDLYGGRFVDGAYISIISSPEEKILQILLSTCPDDPRNTQGRFDWILHEDKYYYLPLSIESASEPISLVAKRALDDDLAHTRQSGEKAILEYEKMGARHRRGESLKTELAELNSGYPIFSEALKLIINGLCYLSAYPDDIELRWPLDTPKPLLEKIDRAQKPKDIQRNTSKLTSMGYTKIHFCGKAFEPRNTDAQGLGSQVRAHWRRGHWRNQPYGPQLSGRRLIWIMPVLVRRDKADGDQLTGHIYIVDE